MKTLDRQKVIFWLDTQTKDEIDLHKVVPAHFQAEFLTIVAEREDYVYNGLKVLKKRVKTNIEILEEFLHEFDFPETHSSGFGNFTNFTIRTFYENFLKCAKSKNKKIPPSVRIHAIKSLMQLKDVLSTRKENLSSKQSLKHG